MTSRTIYDEPIGSTRLIAIARPGPDGSWLVQFIRRGRTGKMLDQCAAWLPSGRWDDHRWHPVGARLVPVEALAAVEGWLGAQEVQSCNVDGLVAASGTTSVG